MNAPAILFRRSLADDGELEIAAKYFHVVEQRSKLPPNTTVIGRYSVLPYYEEVEDDLPNNSFLVNSYKEHKWIADFSYYYALAEYTPLTWFGLREFSSCNYDGPFIIKGATNSKKWNWLEHMYAVDKKDAIKKACLLMDDTYIGNQEIIFRQYIPLKTYEIGINGLPFTNEWRFFCYGSTILSYGYYWDCASEETIAKADIDKNGINFAKNLARLVMPYVHFYTLDIAQTLDGRWILIEVNDGQMSGLSLNSADTLYKNLARQYRN